MERRNIIGEGAATVHRKFPLVRYDRLPDTHDFMKNDGCHIAPHCLTCPRARCIYDEPEAPERYAAAAELFRKGVNVRDVASAFAVSTRSAYRWRRLMTDTPGGKARQLPIGAM